MSLKQIFIVTVTT